MANDTFVYWGAQKPTQQEAEKVIQQFFGDAAKAVVWMDDRFFVTLVGAWSHPLEGIAKLPQGLLESGKPPYDGRCVEVVLGNDYLDVITRMGDEYTNACALGLAKVFSWHWKGELGEL